MSCNLAKLEKIIGYRFRNIELLERAVTHRSWAFEQKPAGSETEIRALQNESLEFVGDSVLGLVISEQLFISNPEMSEGALTLMKHRLVSTETLARLAQAINLGAFMRVGRGEEKTGGRRKQALLADTLEAVLAAIYFDGGIDAARDFVCSIFSDELRDATPDSSIDYKTMLQEILQANRLEAPVYKVVKTEGPPHNRTFFVEAAWEGGSVNGMGNSIKSAEMAAANSALKLLEKEKSNETAANVLQ